MGAWFLMFYLGGETFLERLPKFATFVLMVPWLGEAESDLYWMVPTAALLLLISFFFVSVWIENLVARRLIPTQTPEAILHWAWSANAATYLLLIMLALVWLGHSIVEHQRIAQDEQHTDIDQVSADRLWELAMDKLSKPTFKVTASSGPCKVQAKRDMEQRYWDGRYQLETKHPKQAERIWLSAVAIIDTEGYQKSTTSDDKYADSLNIIGSLSDLYFKQGRFSEARPLYERRVRLEDERLQSLKTAQPQVATYPLNLAITYEKLGDLDKADEFYQRVIAQIGKLKDHFDTMPTLLEYADFCSRHDRLKEAEELYIRAANWHDPGVRHGYEAKKKLAEFYIARRQFEQSEQTLLEAIQEERRNANSEFPNDAAIAPLALDLAKCYVETNNLSQAEHNIKLALRGYSDLGDAVELYAILLKKRGDINQAKIWQKRVKLAKDSEAEYNKDLEAYSDSL